MAAPSRAIVAAQAEVPHGNDYTEPYSAPLRQLFDRFGQQVHLLTPTHVLFPEIARRHAETRLLPEKDDFTFDLGELSIPAGTTMVVIVNPNNPGGGIFDMTPLPDLLRRHPETCFLVDEAFLGLVGETVAHLVPEYPNLLVADAGFSISAWVQTLAHPLPETREIEPLRAGRGQDAFVVVAATRGA